MRRYEITRGHYRFTWRRFWRWTRPASCALLGLAAVGYLLGVMALVAWWWSRLR